MLFMVFTKTFAVNISYLYVRVGSGSAVEEE